MPGEAFGDVAVSFSWLVQYLVILECHFLWQAQHLVMLQCLFFVAGAAFCEIGVDSRSVRDDEFMLGSCSDHVGIMVGSFSNRSPL